MPGSRQVLEELRQPARSLREHIPEVFSAYAGLSKAAMAEGSVTTKTKELLALAIAATRQCDGCIAAHARGAARAGATAAEVAEAMGVVIMMNGGPGTVYGPRAYEAFLEMSVPPGEEPAVTPEHNH
jgi:AhpD family alkylhydroperoxidase